MKSSVAVQTFETKAQLLFQCQQKVVLDQMDHPVGDFCTNLVRRYRVAVEVPDGLDLVSLPV